MSLKLITVFGGSGFVGRHLIRRLAKTGAVIRVAVRNPELAKFLKPMGDVGQITPFAIDISSEEELAAAVSGADAVVNLIGILAQGGGQYFDEVQGIAPHAMARAAAAAGVRRFVQISAIGADAGSRSDYARTKAAGERGVLDAFPGATILRPSLIFGPEDKLFNRFAALAQIAPVLPVIGAETRFQPVYVGDVADAIMTALHRDDAAGRIYELGGPRSYTMREIMELAMEQSGRSRMLVSVPFGLARIPATFLELVPGKPLTRDQVELLKHDNLPDPARPGLAELGIVPTACEGILPSYLDRFRRGGRFARRRAALSD